jgi:hypothetical protein
MPTHRRRFEHAFRASVHLREPEILNFSFCATVRWPSRRATVP